MKCFLWEESHICYSEIGFPVLTFSNIFSVVFYVFRRKFEHAHKFNLIHRIKFTSKINKT